MKMFLCKSIASSIIFNNPTTNKFLMCGCFRQLRTLDLPRVTNECFKNPCLDLQDYLEVPLLKKDVCFDPTIESMKTSLELFKPHKNHIITRIQDTIVPEKFPSHNLPEVAFLGRSNSGKSSLMKAIFNTMPELRIHESKKPGHTKSLKFYQVGTCLCLVDMPGYGFMQPKWFTTSVIPYLKNRKNLVKTFLLVDVQESFHAWDDASLQMLEELKVPFAMVLTKIDAVTDSDRLKNLLHIRNIIKEFKGNTCFPQIFMLSAHTFEGLAYFLAFIAHVTGNLNSKIP